MKIGYARVSTRDRILEAQLEQLRAADCEKIFEGKMSGAGKQNEQQLDALIEFAREGDVVIVTKLDRLGRSLRVILSAIERFMRKVPHSVRSTGATTPMLQVTVHRCTD